MAPSTLALQRKMCRLVVGKEDTESVLCLFFFQAMSNLMEGAFRRN